MQNKPNIALLSGGYSGEAVISVQSAGVIAENINREKYNVYLMKISREEWLCEIDGEDFPVNRHDFSVETHNGVLDFDLAFIMIHGTPGEDGMLQSYFEMLQIPHTTCSAMVSNLTFNKAYTLKFVEAYGAKTARSIYLNNALAKPDQELLADMKLPLFVKPNCGGSSIGMSRVKDLKDVPAAIEKAFKEDDEVIIEEFISGDELTCGVIRHEGKILSFPLTLIRSKNEFFDFEAKYTQGMADEITPPPADIDERLVEDVRKQSEYLYEKLNCRGVVRFDYIHDGKDPYFIEVNTIPGMSSASIVPQQARAAGYTDSELYDMIIENALRD